MPKQIIRRAKLMQRSCLSCDQREQLSILAQQRVLEHELFSSANIVALYAPVRCEVDTHLLFTAAIAADKCVVFPRVRGALMDFVVVRSRDELLAGAFGVLEPLGDMVVAVDQIDLVVVPGVAFDRCGSRLGYGKGFYDRALSVHPFSCVLVGMGYAFQVVDSLPHEDHDLVLDWLITDRETLAFVGAFR
jgi:5-formyltetrahydrofolate cyclo-ligase